MSTQHTPGPWHVDGASVCADNGVPIAGIAGFFGEDEARGNARKWERHTNTLRAKVELLRAIRAGTRLDCHGRQREQLNRRQRKAQAAGVALYDEATIGGLSVGFVKWRNT